MKIRQRLTYLFESILKGNPLAYADASELSSLSGADLWDLFAITGRIREHFHGNKVDLCSIVNAKSGACGEDCAYCAQSMHHATDVSIYPLISVDRMIEAAKSARKNNAKRFCIVTSGRGIDTRTDIESIAQGIQKVLAMGLSPCATLGTLTKDQLSYLKRAGLHRFHHNIETSKEYFPRVCTTHTFEERLEVLGHARSLGLSTCSGGILGMGESMDDRIKMAMTLREIDVDSVPINFLMPIKGTPFEKISAIPPLEALHSIALFRLILPNKEIRVCGGRGTALGQLHPLIFAAGADGFMIGNYLTTAGLDPAADLNMLQRLDLTI
ncbi:MAG TPA: biotin synthase BioB [Nitrospirota bacterium]|nr:biotin synthase BioB [Nitrospirota bacterium]